MTEQQIDNAYKFLTNISNEMNQLHVFVGDDHNLKEHIQTVKVELAMIKDAILFKKYGHSENPS